MKKFVSLALVALLVAGVSGCSKSSDSGKNRADNGKVDKSQKLVIYTNSGSDGRDKFMEELASKQGYHINVVQIDGADLSNRVIAEKNNSQADVIIGLNALEYEKLKASDMLAKYTARWKDDVDMSLGDKQGYYYPIVQQPLVLIYNNKLKDVPADWIDLIKPEYKDKYTLLPLNGGTGKTIYASILQRYLDPKGELGVSSEGWDMVSKLFKNGHIQIPGEDSVGDLISGKRPLTTMWGSGVLQNETERNYKFGIMSPKIGVPFVTEQTAIVSKTKKKALAEDFINWFGSADVQLEWSNKYGTIPASKTALAKAKPEIKDFVAKVHPQTMDWTTINKYMDKWVEKAELNYMK